MATTLLDQIMQPTAGVAVVHLDEWYDDDDDYEYQDYHDDGYDAYDDFGLSTGSGSGGGGGSGSGGSNNAYHRGLKNGGVVGQKQSKRHQQRGGSSGSGTIYSMKHIRAKETQRYQQQRQTKKKQQNNNTKKIAASTKRKGNK